MHIRIALLLLASLLGAQVAVAQSEQFLQLATWETRANNISLRSNQEFALEHFEIPLDRLGMFANEADLPKDVAKSLLVERDGKRYARWIINPEDTKWALQVEAWLKANNLSTQRHKHFRGWQTASRSILVVDPDTKAEFSMKVSTNKTGGNWRDKNFPIADARETNMASNYVRAVENAIGFEHIKIMPEPLYFGIADIDQAMSVRILGDMGKQGGNYYLPGFSAVHEDVGREIAAKNGAKDTSAFWNEHYNKPLARALAEFAAKTGLNYDSPHSQNFLIELDAQLKPTGKIVLRDFGDTIALADHFEAIGYRKFLENWDGANIRRGSLSFSVGIMHGNKPPSWLSASTYGTWGSNFFTVFESTYSRYVSTPISTLLPIGGTISSTTFSYSSALYANVKAASFAIVQNLKNALQKNAAQLIGSLPNMCDTQAGLLQRHLAGGRDRSI